ncbi:hypothetical protein HK405_004844 [Cladochytrium tenue]|nr:hypothetical protein HK405_004844 [Cladochytrium tenue]
MGIGGNIGAGIFTLTGEVANDTAGPVPVSGSAYSYTSAMLGEFIVKIIGWDLILECTWSAPRLRKCARCAPVTRPAPRSWQSRAHCGLCAGDKACLPEVQKSISSRKAQYLAYFFEKMSGGSIQFEARYINAPVTWDEDTSSFITTGSSSNLAAFFVTFGLTIILASGVKLSASVPRRQGRREGFRLMQFYLS